LFSWRLPIRRPIGLAPRLNFLAKVSLIIATFGVPMPLSALLNSRPASTGMPSVRK
jgi:hypothetical protein